MIHLNKMATHNIRLVMHIGKMQVPYSSQYHWIEVSYITLQQWWAIDRMRNSGIAFDTIILIWYLQCIYIYTYIKSEKDIAYYDLENIELIYHYKNTCCLTTIV